MGSKHCNEERLSLKSVGVIVRSTGRNMPMVTKEDHRRLPAPIEGDEEEDEEEEEVEPVRILKEIATFN